MLTGNRPSQPAFHGYFCCKVLQLSLEFKVLIMKFRIIIVKSIDIIDILGYCPYSSSAALAFAQHETNYAHARLHSTVLLFQNQRALSALVSVARVRERRS
jgi:hypothetical protein